MLGSGQPVALTQSLEFWVWDGALGPSKGFSIAAALFFFMVVATVFISV